MSPEASEEIAFDDEAWATPATARGSFGSTVGGGRPSCGGPRTATSEQHLTPAANGLRRGVGRVLSTANDRLDRGLDRVDGLVERIARKSAEPDGLAQRIARKAAGHFTPVSQDGDFF